MPQTPVQFSVEPEPVSEDTSMENMDNNEDEDDEEYDLSFDCDLLSANFEQIRDSFADFLNRLETVHCVSQKGVTQICKEVLSIAERTHKFAVDKIGKFFSQFCQVSVVDLPFFSYYAYIWYFLSFFPPKY